MLPGITGTDTKIPTAALPNQGGAGDLCLSSASSSSKGISVSSSSSSTASATRIDGAATRGRQDSSAMQDVRSYLEWRVRMRRHSESERATSSGSTVSVSHPLVALSVPLHRSHLSPLTQRYAGRRIAGSISPPLSGLEQSIAPWMHRRSVGGTAESLDSTPSSTRFGSSSAFPQQKYHSSSSKQLSLTSDSLGVLPPYSSPAPTGSLMSAIEASHAQELPSPPPPPPGVLPTAVHSLPPLQSPQDQDGVMKLERD